MHRRVLPLIVGLAFFCPALQAQSPFTLTRLIPGEQVFDLQVSGRQVGTLTSTLKLADGAWTYTEATVVPGRTEQTTTLRISAGGEMISVQQNGTTPAGAATIDVAFASGRARGSATTPAQGGQLKTVTIDTTFAPYTIDNNALQALLPALPFAADSKTVIHVFSAGQGTSAEMTLSVVGAERVTVPLGAFDAWKVEAKGAVTVHFFVTKEAPYQLLKLAPAGSPLEMVRVR